LTVKEGAAIVPDMARKPASILHVIVVTAIALVPADALCTDTARRLDSGWSVFTTFVQDGIGHILSGLDHALFIIALMLAVYGWKRLAAVITSFTVAHSITLALCAFNLVSVSPRLVEPLIALTIILVAAECALREKPEARVAVTFGFGLIHGLGFGSVLQRDLSLYKTDLVAPLLGFNVGVEIGQLLVVLPLFPLLVFLRRDERNYRRISRVVAAVVGLAAAWWFVQRIMELLSI